MAETRLLRTDGRHPVCGDTLPIDLTVTNVPAGTTIVKAWLTFKKSSGDADDAATTIQKVITSGFTGTTTVTFTITLSASETAQFAPNTNYLWDVQVKDAAGGIWTPIPDGVAQFVKGRTDATS